MGEIPTTELDAVNTLLAMIGEAPISTLLGPLTALVQIALKTLQETSRTVQLEGWWFNDEENFPLTLDISGTCTVPGNTLDVDLTSEDGSVDLVQRGLRLYDKLHHTYVFTASPRVDITFYLPWEELPEVARGYIKIVAGRKLQTRTIGAASLYGFSAADEQRARTALADADSNNSDVTIFDNWDTASIVTRHRPQTRAF